jgi:hypothetical protein
MLARMQVRERHGPEILGTSSASAPATTQPKSSLCPAWPHPGARLVDVVPVPAPGLSDLAHDLHRLTDGVTVAPVLVRLADRAALAAAVR